MIHEDTNLIYRTQFKLLNIHYRKMDGREVIGHGFPDLITNKLSRSAVLSVLKVVRRTCDLFYLVLRKYIANCSASARY